MSYICNKTNRIFDSKQGLLNHLKYEYKNWSMEDIYKKEGYLNNNKCIICGRETKFISFFKGHHKYWCGSADCKKKIQINTNNKIAKDKINKSLRNIEMLEYVLDNLDFYIENRYKINFFEPYTKKYTKNITLGNYIGRLINTNTINHCIYCNKSINSTIYDKDCICHSCISKKVNGFGYNKLDKRKLANCIFIMEYRGYTKKQILNTWRKKCIYPIYSIYKLNGYNVDKYYKCKETKYYIPIKNKSSALVNHLKKFNIDIVEYIRKYFPDYISYCKECNKICWYSKTLTKKSNESNIFFCNNECYFKYKKKNPSEYYVSTETRKKLSNNLKEMIANGVFIPKNNRYGRKIIKYKEIPFRSSWECLFYISKNENIAYEKLKIKYYDTIKKSIRTYIVDFIDYTNKMVYEIKPSCYNNDINVKDKERALIIWCNKNNYKYEIINEDYFNNLDISYYYKTPKELRKHVKPFFKMSKN